MRARRVVGSDIMDSCLVFVKGGLYVTQILQLIYRKAHDRVRMYAAGV